MRVWVEGLWGSIGRVRAGALLLVQDTYKLLYESMLLSAAQFTERCISRLLVRRQVLAGDMVG